jgi:hypothetical protein
VPVTSSPRKVGWNSDGALTKAVVRKFQHCSWQLCRVHPAHQLLPSVPKVQREMGAAARFPRAAEPSATGREVGLAYSHWRKLWNTTLPEQDKHWLQEGLRPFPLEWQHNMDQVNIDAGGDGLARVEGCGEA